MIGDDALDPGALVLWLAADQVHRVAQLVLEDPSKAFGGLRRDGSQRCMDPAADAEHLLEEALEEHGVPGLVRDLCGEEDALVLGRGSVQQRRKRVGDRLLADEEQRHGVLHHVPNPAGQRFPVDAVLGEVEVRDRPLLRSQRR